MGSLFERGHVGGYPMFFLMKDVSGMIIIKAARNTNEIIFKLFVGNYEIITDLNRQFDLSVNNIKLYIFLTSEVKF